MCVRKGRKAEWFLMRCGHDERKWICSLMASGAPHQPPRSRQIQIWLSRGTRLAHSKRAESWQDKYAAAWFLLSGAHSLISASVLSLNYCVGLSKSLLLSGPQFYHPRWVGQVVFSNSKTVILASIAMEHVFCLT